MEHNDSYATGTVQSLTGQHSKCDYQRCKNCMLSFILTVIFVSHSLILSLSMVCHMPLRLFFFSIHCPTLTAEPWQKAYSCEVKPKVQASKEPHGARRTQPQITVWLSWLRTKGTDCHRVLFERLNIETWPFSEVESYRCKLHRWNALYSHFYQITRWQEGWEQEAI